MSGIEEGFELTLSKWDIISDIIGWVREETEISYCFFLLTLV